jgi:hypothetical protein
MTSRAPLTNVICLGFFSGFFFRFVRESTSLEHHLSEEDEVTPAMTWRYPLTSITTDPEIH